MEGTWVLRRASNVRGSADVGQRSMVDIEATMLAVRTTLKRGPETGESNTGQSCSPSDDRNNWDTVGRGG